MAERSRGNPPDNLVSGERIEAARRARKLSRRTLADLIGCSEEWLRLIEKGNRKLDRLSTLLKIAEVLEVEELSEFLSVPTSLPLPRAEAEYSDIVNDLLHLRESPAEEVPSVHRLCRYLSMAWDLWQRSPRRYSETRRNLPGLLLMAEASADRAAPEDVAVTAVSLTQTYRLFSAFLRKCGQHDLALLASDRALFHARRSTDPLMTAAAYGGLAEVLIRLGRPALARELCLETVERVDALDTGGTRTVSVAGACYLTAALACAAAGDRLLVEQMLEGARERGERLGADRNDLHSAFGPTDVELHAVRIHAYLGRYGQAIKLGESLEIEHLFARERQARHFIALAVSHASIHNATAAVFALQKAAHICPEELRYDLMARQAISLLHMQNNPLIKREVRDIARLAQPER